MGNRGELLLSQYTGSKSLSKIAQLSSLPIDQINFIACQFGALFLSFILKKYIKDPQTRLIYCMVSGAFICNFCFGLQIFHVITSAGLSYFVICNSKSRYMPWYVFTVSMMYLSWLHILRQFFDLAPGYSIDITGPLMVMTQKVTSLAFGVHDGTNKKADKKISKLEQDYAISDVPNLLEYWSFIFQFQSILAGPLVFFKEYREFIYNDQSPNSLNVVLKKLGGSMLFALLYLKAAPYYQIDYLTEDEFLYNTSLVNKFLYIYIATTLERTKYYHAWILSDAVCNASGLGFNKETKTWDLVTNVDAIAFEQGPNLKLSLDQWNKGTMRWLRYVVYERCNNPNIRTFATYTTSAFWHGFYPGYYLTFFSGALFTSSARVVRKTVRPMFVNSSVGKRSYDFITWFTTRIVVAYCTFTFVLLDFIPSIHVYMSIYFLFHVAAVGGMVVLPRIIRVKAGGMPSVSSNVYPAVTKNGVTKCNSVPLIDDFLISARTFIQSNSNLKTGNDYDYEMTKLKTG